MGRVRKARKRDKRKSTRPPADQDRRHYGDLAAVLWSMTTATWGYTGWTVYSVFALHRHMHLYIAVVFLDLLLPSAATYFTHEWWKDR